MPVVIQKWDLSLGVTGGLRGEDILGILVLVEAGGGDNSHFEYLKLWRARAPQPPRNTRNKATTSLPINATKRPSPSTAKPLYVLSFFSRINPAIPDCSNA